MSARDVFLLPSIPVRGVNRFKTTNGNATVAGEPARMLLWDSSIILLYDPDTDDLRHMRPPSGRYFTKVRVESNVLHADFYGINVSGERLTGLPLDDLSALPEGFGPVEDGEFPSAFPSKRQREQPYQPRTDRPRRRDDPLTKRQRRRLEAMERFKKPGPASTDA